MPKNKIEDLRNHLFETLEALKDPDKPMDLARAHAISEIAQTIINSAKIEVDLVKAVNGDISAGNAFFAVQPEARDLPARLAGGKTERLALAPAVRSAAQG